MNTKNILNSLFKFLIICVLFCGTTNFASVKTEPTEVQSKYFFWITNTSSAAAFGDCGVFTDTGNAEKSLAEYCEGKPCANQTQRVVGPFDSENACGKGRDDAKVQWTNSGYTVSDL